jgi:hypothetical protein
LAAGQLASQGQESAIVEALLPAGDGTGAGEEDVSDGLPGVAVGQQQEDMGTVADLGIGMVSVQIQQRLALSDKRRNIGFHGLVSEGSWILLSPLTLEPSLLHRQETAAHRRVNSLSLMRGAI